VVPWGDLKQDLIVPLGEAWERSPPRSWLTADTKAAAGMRGLRISLLISFFSVVLGSAAAVLELLSYPPPRIENANPWKTILKKENDLIQSWSLTLPASLLHFQCRMPGPYPSLPHVIFCTIPQL